MLLPNPNAFNYKFFEKLIILKTVEALVIILNWYV